MNDCVWFLWPNKGVVYQLCRACGPGMSSPFKGGQDRGWVNWHFLRFWNPCGHSFFSCGPSFLPLFGPLKSHVALIFFGRFAAIIINPCHFTLEKHDFSKFSPPAVIFSNVPLIFFNVPLIYHRKFRSWNFHVPLILWPKMSRNWMCP